MSEAVFVDNLVKKYGELTAVAGITFSVKDGEVFGFLGPNGAGKTTTIHVLTTLLKPTSGKAIVGGFDVVEEPSKVRKVIGIVFQDPSIDDQLTAYENMYIHGKIYGVPTDLLKRRIDEMLEFVGLKRFKNKTVKTFSGGMRRRLEIARALIHEPQILFLDEPTLGLDPQTRANIWKYIENLRKEKGVTIFLTTHYMDEAEALCDRIAVIDHGKIIALGTPEELKSMVGEDVVYIRFSPGDGENGESCFQAEFLKECKHVGRDRVAIKVDNASTSIPKIFELAQKTGLRIKEIDYKRPTLNDVFLYLTGREIRESEGSELERIRSFIAARRGLKR